MAYRGRRAGIGRVTGGLKFEAKAEEIKAVSLASASKCKACPILLVVFNLQKIKYVDLLFRSHFTLGFDFFIRGNSEKVRRKISSLC